MKPILFNTETVKAILDGKKTVTRRVVKKDRVDAVLSSSCRMENPDIPDDRFIKCLCTAPCEIGDVLYVRETWSPLYQDKDSKDVCGYMYKACTLEEYEKMYPDGKDYQWEGKWRPSIHMPKEAARIFLRVIDVRVERLQDITYEGCKAEGFDGAFFTDDTEGVPAIAIRRFSRLWDSTIKTDDRDYIGWDANPWVWVIEFERISREEAMSEEYHVD